MELNALTAVSPVDGRYRSKTAPLAEFFSEYGLIRYRVKVEVEYFIALCQLPLPQLKGVSKEQIEQLLEVTLYDNDKIKHLEAFDARPNDFIQKSKLKDVERVKEIEKTTNHDVKAVEYFLREKFDRAGLGAYKEFIHFGLTSQDINNTSVPLSLKDGMEQVILPALEKIQQRLEAFANEWKDIPMLARTHGQPASPTRLGKEIKVFAERLEKQLSQLRQVRYFGKFGGATGNFNAHHVAYPEHDWAAFGNKFLKEHLGLERNQTTTQIDHYDDLSNIFDNLRRINVILLDFARDIWMYIMEDYFKQKVVKNEVGSSAMPHKVNPIDFENAEGNLGIANAILDHLSNKLPVSRLQRDLTDSTVLRNIGVPLGHSLIAYESLLKGMGKLVVNEAAIKNDLEENWAVVAEALQTILRRENYPHPYDKLKEFTRGKGKLNKEVFSAFIDSLEVDDAIKQELLSVTPYNYTGI